jgi:hypothetical protein
MPIQGMYDMQLAVDSVTTREVSSLSRQAADQPVSERKIASKRSGREASGRSEIKLARPLEPLQHVRDVVVGSAGAAGSTCAP